MELECFAIHDSPHAVLPEIRPGNPRREWMDNTNERFAYRCLPLNMANGSGWEILCPFDFTAEWNGGPNNEDIKISSGSDFSTAVTGEVTPDDDSRVKSFAISHFRTGILTFHTGYLFRTTPGVGLWCMGAPNFFKDGIQALSGLIETDWLPFPFTMNWQFTRAGKVEFKKGEPFCFFTLMEHGKLEAVQPEIKSLSSEPQLQQDYHNWHTSRSEFINRLEERDESAISQGWQRHYMKGEKSDGDAGSDSHLSRLRLRAPKDVR